MQQLIASYLFQNKTCPLPGLGTLSIHTSGAEADFTIKQISAPKRVIQFENKESDASGLLNYVAATTHSNNYEVTEALDHFCDNLKNEISNQANAKLEGIGNFFAGTNGQINFKQEETVWKDLVSYAAKDSIDLSQISLTDKSVAQRRIKALLARQPWRNEGFYEVLSGLNINDFNCSYT